MRFCGLVVVVAALLALSVGPASARGPRPPIVSAPAHTSTEPAPKAPTSTAAKPDAKPRPHR